MDEIIKKLEEMGVRTDSKAVKAWLKARNQSIETVGDDTIFAMAEALGSSIASSVENLPVGWDKIEGGLEYDATGETIESIATRDGILDADRILSEYQSAYKQAFASRFRSLATFRSDYRNQAAALLSA